MYTSAPNTKRDSNSGHSIMFVSTYTNLLSCHDRQKICSDGWPNHLITRWLRAWRIHSSRRTLMDDRQARLQLEKKGQSSTGLSQRRAPLPPSFVFERRKYGLQQNVLSGLSALAFLPTFQVRHTYPRLSPRGRLSPLKFAGKAHPSRRHSILTRSILGLLGNPSRLLAPRILTDLTINFTRSLDGWKRPRSHERLLQDTILQSKPS